MLLILTLVLSVSISPVRSATADGKLTKNYSRFIESDNFHHEIKSLTVGYMYHCLCLSVVIMFVLQLFNNSLLNRDVKNF